MNEDSLLSITQSIESKLGKEAIATISDDIGMLITENTNVLKTLSEKDKEIKNLKSTNEKLVTANGNLLQQVPMASDYEKHQTKKSEEVETKKSFNMKDAFDSKGNFKH